jgi:hypothetical protein
VAAPRFNAIPWPPLAALFALALMAAPYAALREFPPLVLMPFAAGVAALFYVSAAKGRAGALLSWAATGIAALSLFAITLLSVALPGIGKIWPARQIENALAGCAPGPIAVLGLREPTSRFVLKSDESLAEPEAMRSALVEGRSGYLVGEVRDSRLSALNRFQYRRLRPLACVEAYNTMRGCPLYFTIVATGDMQTCNAREAYPCTEEFMTRAAAAKAKPGCE